MSKKRKQLYSLDQFIQTVKGLPKYKKLSDITYAGFINLMRQKDMLYTLEPHHIAIVSSLLFFMVKHAIQLKIDDGAFHVNPQVLFHVRHPYPVVFCLHIPYSNLLLLIACEPWGLRTVPELGDFTLLVHTSPPAPSPRGLF